MIAIGSRSTPRPTTAPEGLASRSFVSLVLSQFLGAFNDNLFRWLIIPIGKDYAGGEQTDAILAVGLACLAVPFLIFAAPAGWLADRFSKRRVMVWAKFGECVVMPLGAVAIWTGSVPAMFAVLFLMGIQSAMFSPARLGCIPEIVRPDLLSRANGILGMASMMAVITGTVAGSALYNYTMPFGTNHQWVSTTVIVTVGVLGWLVTLGIRHLPAANPRQTFPWNFVKHTLRELGTLRRSRVLGATVAVLGLYWGLASLAQINVDKYVTQVLGYKQNEVSMLLGILTIGIAVGSVLAGFLSGRRIELGMVAFGGLGMIVSSVLLWANASSLPWAGVCMFFLGASAGAFDVPLEAFLQHRSPAESRGSILAAYNFVAFTAMLIVSGVFPLLTTGMHVPLSTWDLSGLELSAGEIFLVMAGCTLPVVALFVWYLPAQTVRFPFLLAARLFYRTKIRGLENIPAEGGALLVANHVSWADGVLLMLFCPRNVRMVGYAPYLERGFLAWLARTYDAIPIEPESRRSIIEALRTARAAVRQGDLVCIFPEGGLTRTGELQEFKPGALAILQGTSAPVIPVYLGGLWGSIFSFWGGRFFWKRPQRWPYPVSITFGPPIQSPGSIEDLRRAVEGLAVESESTNMSEHASYKDIPTRVFLRNCRASMKREKIVDSTGQSMTGASLLVRALVFRRLLEREVFDKDETHVGLLLPPSAGSILANIAIPLGGRIPVNLNYTVSSEIMQACINEAGIRHVLTSKRVMSRLNLKIDAKIVYLEDLIPKVTKVDKLLAAVQAYATPIPILERMLGLTRLKPDDVLTVLFTSGSTGEPKGVMLTNRNISSNVWGIDQTVKLTEHDVALGILPFFHSYGYTCTMWTALMLAPKGAYHFNPLESQVVGELCRKVGGTILMATPTFLRAYLRRCEPSDLKSLHVIFASAERLPPELSDAFEERFGMRPMEAYGATEMSPLIAVNVPERYRAPGNIRGAVEGSVGMPIPGTEAKVVDPDTGADLGRNNPGMLWVRGPNVMLGYMNKPELTATVVKDGWYVTGDIAYLDDEGYIHITGRLSRFSKLGGEMVPHIKIEETIRKIVGGDEDHLSAVVTAVPDPKKGERLIVLHTSALDRTPDQISRGLQEEGLPNLWIPSNDSYFLVDEIPVLGTGKLDLKALKDMAMERCSGVGAQ